MSHFICVVACKSPDDIRALLALYDETIEVEPYRDRIEGKPSDHWFWDGMRKHGYDGPDEWGPYAAALNAHRDDDSEKTLVDDEGAYTMSPYNPDSRWDWYSIGGRWSGYFAVKPDHDGDPALGIGQPGAFDNAPTPGRVDYGPKGMLDLAAMRNQKADEAVETWESVHAALEGTAPAVPWGEFRARAEAGAITIDQARSLYALQPRVEAFRSWCQEREYFFASLEDYDMPRERFVEHARAGAVPGYACLIDGQWYEPGKMGWFGVSSETLSSKAGYWEHVNGLIDSLPDDTYLVAVDCHI